MYCPDGIIRRCWNHVRCFAKTFRNDETRLNSAEYKCKIDGYRALSAQDKQTVDRLFWPLEAENPAQLRLHKDVRELAVQELKLELLKRGKHVLHRNQRDLQDRLRRFLVRDDVAQFQMQDNASLVAGYIRENDKALCLRIPLALLSMFQAYCPYQSADQLANPRQPAKQLRWILRNL